MTTDKITTELLAAQCVPVAPDDSPLTGDEIETLQTGVFGWEVAEHNDQPCLVRIFTFEDVSAALRFVQEVGQRAVTEQQQPHLVLKGRQVTVRWGTPELDGLHRNNFIMAAQTGDVFNRWREVTGQKDAVERRSEDSFPASDPPGSHSIT